MTTVPGPSALRLIITLIISTLLFSCGGNSAQDGSGAGIAFRLKWPVAKSVGLVPSGVDTIRMSVSGPNMTTISRDFIVSDYPNGGSITNVQVGSNRTITFQGFSGPSIIYQAVRSNVTLVGGVTYDCGIVTMTPVANSSTSDVPTAPSGLGGTVASSNQINLLWVDNANNETGYKIERKTGADGTYALIAAVAANDTIYSDTTLSASTTYYYRVCATNDVGDSGYSNEYSATTSVVAPASSYSISGTVTSGGSALAGATVTRSGNGTTTTTTDSAGNYSFSGVQNGSYTLTPAKSGYTFDPQNRAVTLDGANLSAMNFAATAVSTVPTAPSGLNITAASSGFITLAWTDNAGNETGYKIERSVSGGPYVQIDTVAANVTIYNDTALSASTTYSYR
ncbi:MAG: carboxypeptidase regulatory-like domain-containing protein, partial [Desulfuromonadaceae bacterium]